MTAEQLEASRSERMRQNGVGTLTLEDARTWIEETGLCLFLPRKQFSAFVAPSFVEAVAGERSAAPPAKVTALAEELLVRLETDGVAVRLNLQGQPGEQPDFVVATWVLPYVYALRGDRDWRRIPQLTGSRAVSQLAIQAYKLLEAGDATIPQLKHALGREVTESAVLRAITELWQQLRIIPVIAAPGRTPQWQLLRVRFQKAIAEGASTSQVTAISVLASIYLQAVIAASMEEVELFLAPLTARSKVREVLRGLVATRQVHTISMGHAPQFYVAGTLPEFSIPSSLYGGSYSSSAMPASAQFLRSYERDYEAREPSTPIVYTAPAPAPPATSSSPVPTRKPEEIAPRIAAQAEEMAEEKLEPARLHFNRNPAHALNRKPASGSSNGRVSHGAARSNGARSNGGSRHAAPVRWSHGPAKNGRGNGNGNGQSKQNGSHAKGSSSVRKAKPAAARSLHNGHVSNGKPVAKSSARPAARPASRPTSRPAARPAARRTPATRPGARPSARPGTRPGTRSDARTDARSRRKPALTASAKAGNRTRYGFTAPGRQRTKKRG